MELFLFLQRMDWLLELFVVRVDGAVDADVSIDSLTTVAWIRDEFELEEVDANADECRCEYLCPVDAHH